jgi:hypothetical protein
MMIYYDTAHIPGAKQPVAAERVIMKNSSRWVCPCSKTYMQSAQCYAAQKKPQRLPDDTKLNAIKLSIQLLVPARDSGRRTGDSEDSRKRR